MSAFKFVTLACDLCPAIFHAHTTRIRGARREAAADGWEFHPPTADLCPACAHTYHSEGTRNA